MMAKRSGKQRISLEPPYLRRVWLEAERVPDRAAYPYCLPFLTDDFELTFDKPITIIAGENGVGKSTLLEGIAALAGFDPAGGASGYRPVDHEQARETNGDLLADVLRAAWRPKITTGWFFRAESFFSVARYLDAAGSTTADFLSHSHGEGFMRLFGERCDDQGIYFFDEPESALSPARQIEFLRLLQRIDDAGLSQVVMATHSPLLMAFPKAQLLRMTLRGLEPVTLEQTDHFRLLREFCGDPHDFIAEALARE